MCKGNKESVQLTENFLSVEQVKCLKGTCAVSGHGGF